MKDFQRSKAYEWEAPFVWKGEKIEIDKLQTLINYIWQEEGLSHPPQIKKKHKNRTTCAAHANRFEIGVDQGGITTNVLLHELAHSMTAHFEGKSAMHGPRWVGVYILLLVKYARMNRIELEMSAIKHGLKFDSKGVII